MSYIRVSFTGKTEEMFRKKGIMMNAWMSKFYAIRVYTKMHHRISVPADTKVFPCNGAAWQGQIQDFLKGVRIRRYRGGANSGIVPPRSYICIGYFILFSILKCKIGVF